MARGRRHRRRGAGTAAYPTRELERIVECSGVTFLTEHFVMDALLARILGLVIERRAEPEPRPDAALP